MQKEGTYSEAQEFCPEYWTQQKHLLCECIALLQAVCDSLISDAHRNCNLLFWLPEFYWRHASELGAEPGPKTKSYRCGCCSACHVPLLLCGCCGCLPDGAVSVSPILFRTHFIKLLVWHIYLALAVITWQDMKIMWHLHILMWTILVGIQENEHGAVSLWSVLFYGAPVIVYMNRKTRLVQLCGVMMWP